MLETYIPAQSQGNFSRELRHLKTGLYGERRPQTGCSARALGLCEGLWECSGMDWTLGIPGELLFGLLLGTWAAQLAYFTRKAAPSGDAGCTVLLGLQLFGSVSRQVTSCCFPGGDFSCVVFFEARSWLAGSVSSAWFTRKTELLVQMDNSACLTI
ncbi:hypothetical protein MHYP_G00033380 [Metynnis hypsauchen]